MDKKELQKLLNQPYKQENWKEIIQFVFPNVSILSTPKDFPINNDKIKRFRQIGSVKLNDGKSLALFELLLADTVNMQRNRVELNNEISRYIDQEQIHGVLSVFEQGTDDYRFTFSARSTEFDEEEHDFVVKKTDTKRYTYVLGKNESCKTPAERFFNLSENKAEVDINAIQNAFSVEQLSKEFFNNYKKQFEKFWTYIASDEQYKNIFYADDQDQKELKIRNFTKKLLGRIVFLHFLQKKGWLGCPAEKDTWEDGDKKFVQNLFKAYSNKENFHSKCLVELFYNTLNKKRENNLFKCEGLEGSLNSSKVPYLNGGLFDSDKAESKKINFPEQYFEELFDFFGQYNFTIDENDPNDHEVGIDPEMLGHIFENLLEDNKDKGAFYTPKIVVQYMCQESVIEYIATKLNAEGNVEVKEAIEDLLRNRLAEKSSDLDLVEPIAQALYDVKVCDPAIGSGAFPMGILNVIFQTIENLFGIQPDTVARVWNISDSEWEPHLVKKNIIQHSIYGVDIECGAIDIARLRFWLALVVDEKEPLPLPNLDYKIMQGNSLLESFEGIDLSQISNSAAYKSVYETDQIDMFSGIAKKKVSISLNFEDIQALMNEYFNANDPDAKKYLHKRIDDQVLNHIHLTLSEHKKDLKKKANKLDSKLKLDEAAARTWQQKEKIRTISKGARELFKLNKKLSECDEKENKLAQLSKSIERPFFLWHLFFKEVFDNGGFDIVIGNPPYLKVQNIPKEHAEIYKSIYKTPHNKYDIYVIFIELAFNLIKENGTICYINPHRFIIAEYGQKLRDYLLEKKGIKRFINFGVNMVFENATAYTGIFIFSKDNKHVEYTEVKSKNLKEHKLSKISYQLLNNTWLFTSNQNRIDIVEKILEHSHFEKYFLGVYQGAITIGDDIQILNGKIGKETFTGFSKSLNKVVTIEKDLMKPILKGENIRRYLSPHSERYIFYPHYVDENSNTIPYSENEMKNLFPLGYQYISHFKEDLILKKIKYKTNSKYWYSLHRSRDYNLFTVPKLITPQLQNNSHFTFDKSNFLTDAGGYIIVPTEENKKNMLGFLALFNSSTFYYFIQSTSTPYNNNYYYFKTNYISPFRISEKFIDSIEIFTELATKCMDAIDNKNEEKINIMVAKCYNLNFHQYQEISPDTSLTENEFNEYLFST